MGALGAAEDTDRDWGDLELSYHTVRPNKWTFQSEKIRRWVQRRLEGRVLNACAGKTKLAHDHEIVRNDINEQRDADLHLDVCEIADELEAGSFDTIVYDPPFSQYQASRSYDGQDVGDAALAKRQFDLLLRPGGRVIQFGFTTTCMPFALGYERQEVAVWNTLGRQNDYLSAVDKKEGETEINPRWFSCNNRSVDTDTDRDDLRTDGGRNNVDGKQATNLDADQLLAEAEELVRHPRTRQLIRDARQLEQGAVDP